MGGRYSAATLPQWQKLQWPLIGETYIKRSFFQEGLYDHSSFDVIIFRNLLEHLYDLHGFLDAVRRCLRPGGIALIDVPNIKTLSQLGGFGLFFHQHISLFSPTFLTILLEQAGFSIQETCQTSENIYIVASNDNLDFGASLFQTSVEKVGAEFKKSRNENVKKIAGYMTGVGDAVIWGAGGFGIATIELCKVPKEKIDYFVDSDMEKIGNEYLTLGHEIRHPSYLERDPPSLLIVASMYADEIIQQSDLAKKTKCLSLCPKISLLT